MHLQYMLDSKQITAILLHFIMGFFLSQNHGQL